MKHADLDLINPEDADALMQVRDPWVRLRAASAQLQTLEATRIKLANSLGITADGTPIPSRTAHVFDAVTMRIPDADNRRTIVNLTPLGMLEIAETAAEKTLIAAYKECAPERLQTWANNEIGVGDKTLARVLGEIGNPRLYQPMEWVGNPDYNPEKVASHENPKRSLVPSGEAIVRTLGMLRQYSRLGDWQSHPRHWDRLGIEPTQAALFKAGREPARKRLYVVAETVVRQSFRYRDDPRLDSAIQAALNAPKTKPGDSVPPVWADLPLAMVYLIRKATTEGRTHQAACSQCKAGHNDPWRPAHRDQDARRIVAKDLLRRIWENA